MTADLHQARRRHYGDFYGDTASGRSVDRPVVVVGNCQVESLRLLLDPGGTRSVRVPPVFEMEADDLPHLWTLLGQAEVLVTQPVRDDYRGLPLGTDQLRPRLRAGARTVLVPSLRFSGLHPHHVLHHPPDGVGDPPVVPYHDLRVLRRALHPGAPAPQAPTPDAVRAVAAASQAELERREQATDVRVSDQLAPPRVDDFRTVNHPGNRLLLAVAGQIAEIAGLPRPQDPGRQLLASVVAPVEEVVARTWGLTGPRPTAWTVDGREVAPEEVDAAHTAWYAEHPEVAAQVWRRFDDVATLLGLVG